MVQHTASAAFSKGLVRARVLEGLVRARVLEGLVRARVLEGLVRARVLKGLVRARVFCPFGGGQNHTASSEYELDSFFNHLRGKLRALLPVPWLQGECQPLKTVLRGKTATRLRVRYTISPEDGARPLSREEGAFSSEARNLHISHDSSTIKTPVEHDHYHEHCQC